MPGSVHVPRLGALLHSLLQLQLQGQGNQRSSEIWGKPATEYFVTDYLRKGKRADYCLSGATTNALLLLWDCSKISSESKMRPPQPFKEEGREEEHPQRLCSTPFFSDCSCTFYLTSGEGEGGGRSRQRAAELQLCPPPQPLCSASASHQQKRGELEDTSPRGREPHGLLSPLHLRTTSVARGIAAVTPHCWHVDGHDFAISGDGNANPLLLRPSLSCHQRHRANSYTTKTRQINTSEYKDLFACPQTGLALTWPRLKTCLSSSHSLLVHTVHFTVNVILKEMDA